MTLEIKTQITITATPENVWNHLTNFEEYKHWNPFIKSVKGVVEKGQKVEVIIQPPNSKQVKFKPTILSYKTNTEIRWIGHLLFPGIFDGEHIFTIVDNKNGTVNFFQSEVFSGILVRLFKSSLLKNTKNGFRSMNEKLKERAEKSSNIPS